jgi:hypothetical protein
MITTIDFLFDREAADVLTALDQLRRFWVERDVTPPIYTLGAASYLDHSNANPSFYYAKARLFNPILRQRLGWLYERLEATLASHLEEPVAYAEALGLPGFNIYLGEKMAEGPAGRMGPRRGPSHPHYDQQGILPDCDRSEPGNLPKQVSFTLPMVLPTGGGGLNVWDLHAAETAGMPDATIRECLESRRRRNYPYCVGRLVLQSGLYYHQVAGVERMRAPDRRITLQGHGLFCHGAWRLYF